MSEESQLSAIEKRQLILFGLGVALVIVLAAVLRGCFIALRTPSPAAGLVEIGHVDDFPPGTVRALELPVSFELPAFVIENLDLPPDEATAGPITPLPLFVVHDEEAGLLVFYGNSPFRGCTIAWVEANGRFENPCHGDKYTVTGDWIEGPSTRGLDQFPVQVQDDGRILIDAGALIPGPPAPTETAAPTNPAVETSTPAPEPPTPAPTTAPLSLESFLDHLQQALNERDFGDLEEQTRPIFVTGIYPAATGTAALSEVIPHLESRLLPIEPDVDIYEVDAAALPDSLTAETLFDEEAQDITVIGSSGWGLAGSGAGLLYILEEEGAYRWVGLVVAYESFTPSPILETVASPPDLIYQIESFQYEWWRVSAQGEPESLIRRNAQLSLNPDATVALQAGVDEQSVTLFHLADGNSETISLDETLMIDSLRVRWLDERTAVLAIANEPVSQGTRGLLALLDTTSGQLTLLDAEVDSYVQPSVTEDGAIIASAHEPGQFLRWQNGKTEIVTIPDLAAQDKILISPILSPDGSSVAFDMGGAYAVAALEQPAYRTLHTYTAIGTDAVVPRGITWSPDGRWLALSPPSWDVVESGAWLVAADGTNKIYLGPGSGDVVWLDAERFVFSAVLNGKAGLQLYDVTTGERFWLNRPTFDVESMSSGFWLDVPVYIAPVQCVC